MFHLLLVASLFCHTDCTKDAPEISTIKNSNLFQVPRKTCYIQYGEAVDLVRQYAPVKLASLNFPYCLCEYEVPYYTRVVFTPTQLILTVETLDKGVQCNSNINVLKCDSFDKDRSCMAKVWIGKSPEDEENYVFDHLLECSSGASDEHNNPEYPVEVYGIDRYDVGMRCSSDDIVLHLNRRLEIYRKNSQFYWRNLVSQNVSEILDNCDPNIRYEGSALKLYFRCIRDLPQFDSAWHRFPSERQTPIFWRSNNPDWPMCYHIPRIPREDQYVTELDPDFETGAPVCVCEQPDHITLKMSQMHKFGDGERVKGQQCRSASHIREYYCAAPSSRYRVYQCIYDVYPRTDPGLDVVIGCKPDLEGTYDTIPENAYESTWGTKYYPKTKLSIRWVELKTKRFGNVKQIWLMSYCGFGERDLYDALRTQINENVVDWSNTEYHRRTVFNPMKLADSICPKNLTLKFLEDEVGERLYWEIAVECK